MSTNEPIPDDPDDEALGEYLHRRELSMRELNARIARLGIVLGVDTENNEVVDRLIRHKLQPTPATPYAGPDRRAVPRNPNSKADRRRDMLFEELRGLLVLRYQISRNFVEQLGAETAMLMLEHAAAHPSRHGVSPSVDGLGRSDQTESH